MIYDLLLYGFFMHDIMTGSYISTRYFIVRRLKCQILSWFLDNVAKKERKVLKLFKLKVVSCVEADG